jgi:hypothetical protein
LITPYTAVPFPGQASANLTSHRVKVGVMAEPAYTVKPLDESTWPVRTGQALTSTAGRIHHPLPIS